MRLVFASAVALCAAFTVSAQDDKKPVAQVRVEKDIVFGKGGAQELMLDLARPADERNTAPCIVCVHGGGWRGGKRQDLGQLTKVLAEKGFIAATVSYRLTPGAQFPAQIEDCKAAVRFLRASADKYQIRKDKIGAVGFSAGGHLVSLLGTADPSAKLEGDGGHSEQSSRVQAVVSYFGPTDFINKTWTKEVEDYFLVPFLGGSFEDKRDHYRRCSPLEYVSRDDPPFLCFHGDKDTLVRIDNSEKLTKKLQDVGVSARLVTMEGEGHGWAGDKLTRTLQQTVQFFEEKLKK
jgi:acetyl esterase/lipase